MSKLFLGIVVCFVLLSSKSQTSEPDSPILIGYVTTTDEVDGYACFLHTPSDTKKRSIVIFDYENPAIMQLNNRKEVFTESQAIHSPNPDVIRKVYQNNSYTLQIELKLVKKIGAEAWYYKGNLIVKNTKSGQRVEKQVVGECGN